MYAIDVNNRLEVDTVFSLASSNCVLQSFHFVVGRCFVCWYVVQLSPRYHLLITINSRRTNRSSSLS
jgi:hypothetical protein